MELKNISLICMFVLSITLVSAQSPYSDCSVYGNCHPVSTSTSNITNINNTYINQTLNITNNITNNIVNNYTTSLTNWSAYPATTNTNLSNNNLTTTGTIKTSGLNITSNLYTQIIFTTLIKSLISGTTAIQIGSDGSVDFKNGITALKYYLDGGTMAIYDYITDTPVANVDESGHLRLQNDLVVNNYNLTGADTYFGRCINFSDGTQQCSATDTDGMNYTNIALTNQSNNFNGTINVTNGYLMGQPLTGMLGSGLILSTELTGTRIKDVNVTCTGLVCRYNNFTVRIMQGTATAPATYCTMGNGTLNVPDNTNAMYYVDSNCAIQQTTYDTWFSTTMLNGGTWDFVNILTHSGSSEVIDSISLEQRRLMKMRALNYYTWQSKVLQGFNFQVGTFPQFNITSGKIVYGMDVVDVNQHNISASDTIEWVGHNSSTTWKYTDGNHLNITSCDNGTAVIACTGSNYRRHFIFSVGYDASGSHSEIHQVYPLASRDYSTLAQCLDTVSNPLTYTLPQEYTGSAVLLYAYCAKRTDTSWTTTNLIDLRTVKSGTASSGTDTSGLVPYSGANNNLNLAGYNITADYFTGNGITNPMTNNGIVFINSTGTQTTNNTLININQTSNKFNTTADFYAKSTSTTGNINALNVYATSNVASGNAFWFNTQNLLMSPSTAMAGDTGNAYCFADNSGISAKQIKASSLILMTNVTTASTNYTILDNKGNGLFKNNVTAGYFYGNGGNLTGIAIYNSTYDATSKDVSTNRSAFLSTYNSTYATWAYNQTELPVGDIGDIQWKGFDGKLYGDSNLRWIFQNYTTGGGGSGTDSDSGNLGTNEVGHWKLDETSGNTASTTVNSPTYDGTIGADISYFNTTGKLNGAFHFEESLGNYYVEVVDGNPYSCNNNPTLDCSTMDEGTCGTYSAGCTWNPEGYGGGVCETTGSCSSFSSNCPTSNGCSETLANNGVFGLQPDSSLAFWIKTTDNRDEPKIFTKLEGGSIQPANGWYFKTDGSDIKIGGFDGTEYDIGDFSQIGDGNWHLVVLTINDTINLNIDNNPISSVSYTTTPQIFGQPFRMAGSSVGGGAGYWNGTLDDVRYYSRALEQTDIDDLWGSGSSASYSNNTLYVNQSVTSYDYITLTDVYDTKANGDALSKIKDSSTLIKDGVINHSAFDYAYKPFVSEKTTINSEVKCGILGKLGLNTCKKISTPITTQTIVEGVSLVKQVSLLFQAVYELKVKIETLEAKDKKNTECLDKSEDFKQYKECLIK